MMRTKVDAVLAFLNSVLSTTQHPPATEISEAQALLPLVFEQLDIQLWNRLATSENVYENAVKFLQTDKTDSELVSTLDPEAANTGDDEEAMKILVMVVSEVCLRKRSDLKSIEVDLTEVHQKELTTIMKHIMEPENWSTSRGWAEILYRPLQVDSSSEPPRPALTPMSSPNVFSTPATSRKGLTRYQPRRPAHGGDSPLKEYLNSPRMVEKAQLKALHKENTLLRTRVAEMEKVVETLENSNEDINEKKRALENLKLTLEDRLRKAKDEAANASWLRLQVQKLEDERKELSEELHKHKTRCAESNADLERWRAAHHAAEMQAESAIDKLHDERSVVESLQTKLNDMTEEHAAACRKVQDAERRLRDLERSFNTRFEEADIEWRTEVENLTARFNNKDKQYLELVESQACVAGQYMDQINEQQAKIDELTATARTATEELSEATAENVALKELLDTKTRDAELGAEMLERQRAETGKHSEEVRRLEALVADGERRREAQQESIGALEEKLREVADANNALRADCERRLTERQAAVDDAEHRLAEYAALIETLQKDLQAARDRQASTSKDCAAAKKKIEELAEDNRRLTARSEALQREMDELNEEHRQNIAEQEDRHQKITADMVLDHRNAHSQLLEVKDAKKKVEATLELTQTKLLAAEARLAELEAAEGHSIAKRTQLEQLLNNANQMMGLQQNKIEELQSEIAVNLAGMDQMVKAMCATERSRDDAEAKVVALEQQLAALQEGKMAESRLEDRLRQAECESASLRENFAHVMQAKKALEAQNVGLRSQVDDHKDRIQQLECQLRTRPSATRPGSQFCSSSNISETSASYTTARSSMSAWPLTSTPIKSDEFLKAGSEDTLVFHKNIGDGTLESRKLTSDDCTTTLVSVKALRSRSVSNRGHEEAGLGVRPSNTLTKTASSMHDVSWDTRTEELRARNMRQLPHMRSNYPAEPVPAGYDPMRLDSSQPTPSGKRKGPVSRVAAGLSSIFTSPRKAPQKTRKDGPK